MTQNTETQAVLDLVTRLQHVSMDLGVPSTTTLNSKVVAEVADTLRALLAERDAARAEVAVLMEALEFYADRDYVGYDVSLSDYGLSIIVGEIIKDGGDKARTAIAELTGGKDE